ncbi:MAG: adenylyltransferase/cytidyltransferase family protein [bacterium]
MINVLAFGVFDGLHPGHESFLKQASELGDRLIVSLAPDKVVADLKGREVNNKFVQRKSALEALDYIDSVVEGDYEQDTYSSIMKFQPDVIALGYDQAELEKSIRAWLPENNLQIQIVKLKAHEPKKFKSSLMR